MSLTKPRIYVGSNGHDLLYYIKIFNPDPRNLEWTVFCVNFVNDRKSGLAKVFIQDNKLIFSRISTDNKGLMKEETYSYPISDWVIENITYGIKRAHFETCEDETAFKIEFNEFR